MNPFRSGTFSAMDRRQFFGRTGALAAAGIAASWLDAAEAVRSLPFTYGDRPLVAYPQKRPLLRLTARPPQLETPFEIFNEGVLTSNDAFFVRYHLADIPTEIDPAAFRLNVGGRVKAPLRLSLEELRNGFEPVEVVAVNQCSGNSRGFTLPRVPGGQLGNGAMGNARWRGVRLRDVLHRAGLATGVREVTFDGLDRPVLDATPDFVKALPVDHAVDGEVMVAYATNGADLPMLNGFPLRLVVPGYYGTYWVKHLNRITVLDQPFDGFWMSQAYRIPTTPNASIPSGTKPLATTPIGRLNVRSFITSMDRHTRLSVGRAVIVRGIAFDGGAGIREVLFSDDGGRSWRESSLGRDLGRYSFREWTVSHTPRVAGPADLRVRAVNRRGETQPLEAGWNPAGYMRNGVEAVHPFVTA